MPNYITLITYFPAILWHSLTHTPLFNESHFTSFCITAEEGPRTETFCTPLKLILCFKLNTLPVHHCHTAMNLYEIKQRCNSKAELKEAPNCVKWQCCVSNWWLKGGVIQKALQPSYTGREWHSSSLSDCGRVLLESCVGGLYRWATFWPSCHLTIANAPTLVLFVCMFVLYTSLRRCKEPHETLHTHWWGPWTCSYRTGMRLYAPWE